MFRRKKKNIEVIELSIPELSIKVMNSVPCAFMNEQLVLVSYKSGNIPQEKRMVYFTIPKQDINDYFKIIFDEICCKLNNDQYLRISRDERR